MQPARDRSIEQPPPWFVEPSLLQRFGGSLIDGLVLLPLALVLLAVDGVAATLLVLGFRAAYEILLTAHDGQTVGKMAMGTRAVDSVAGTVPSAAQAVLRWAALSGAPALLGAVTSLLGGIYLLVIAVMVLRPPLHQGLHDRLAGTLVTNVRPRR